MITMKKLIILFLLLLIPLASADEKPVQVGESVNFIHIIRLNGAPSDSITANITITGPSDQLLIGFESMSYNSINKTFNYTFGDTNEVGTYERCITATDGELNETACFDFEVTPSGAPRINEGESIAMIGGGSLMVLVSLMFFIMFLRVNNVVAKVAFLSGSVITLFMTVLFITVTFQQNLAGFENIVGGFETFVFVMKTLMTIALVAFSVFGILMIGFFFIKQYRRRRGIDD